MGDVTISPNETIGTVIVADGNATVEGEVTDTLIVFSGTATVNGTVGGDIVMVVGNLTLGQASTVGNVTLFRSEIDRAGGATITGDLSEQDDGFAFGRGVFVFTVLMWLGVTLALIAATVLFAWIGGRQLAGVGETVRHQPGPSVMTALVLMFGLPLVAIGAFVTVIGIPIGAAILPVAIPAL